MESKRYTYPKSEKLKKRGTIDLLFAEGKSVSAYPVRLVYVPLKTEGILIEMGVSVSKKHFKKAVDRNYYKRLLREAYRLNKHLLTENLSTPHAFMLLYQTKDRLTFEEVGRKTLEALEKFLARINDDLHT